MTEYLLTAGLTLIGFSASLYTAGVAYRTVESWMEGLQIFRLTTTAYRKEK